MSPIFYVRFDAERKELRDATYIFVLLPFQGKLQCNNGIDSKLMRFFMLSYQIFNSVHEYEKKNLLPTFIPGSMRSFFLILFVGGGHTIWNFSCLIFFPLSSPHRQLTEKWEYGIFIFLHPWQSLPMNPINVHNEPHRIVWVKRSHLVRIFCMIIIEKK